MRAFKYIQAIAIAGGVAIAAALVVWFALFSTWYGGLQPTALAFSHPAVSAGQACDAGGCHEGQGHAADSPFAGPCQDCHTLQSWSDVFYVHKDPAFNQGIHARVACGACHTADNPKPKPECSGCHELKHVRPFGVRCAQCHVPQGWVWPVPAPAGHVSLEGGHAGVNCLKCHKSATALPPNNCASCHGKAHGGFTSCTQCHTPAAFWVPVLFNHQKVFKLYGAHLKVPCEMCHPGQQFAKASPACANCHKNPHGPQMTTCQNCHTTAAWIPSTFRHSRVFALTGQHAKIRCSACHPAGLNFAVVKGRSCAGCHGMPHGGCLPVCSNCHNTSSFSNPRFSHNSVWPRTGAHAKLRCSKCHGGPGGIVFCQVAGRNCTNCHGLPHGSCLPTCQNCHNTTSFANANFNHNSVWPRTGAHATLACSKCHPGGIKFCQVPGTTCVSCHGVQHGGQTQCQLCHNTSSFAYVNNGFRHPQWQGNSGSHLALACTQCHAGPNPNFTLANPACASCHTSPHVGPSDCQRCHNTTAWNVINFQHVPLTFHPAYTGINQNCNNCHPGGNFTHYQCTPCHQNMSYPPPGY
jgi:hypothetical protein